MCPLSPPQNGIIIASNSDQLTTEVQKELTFQRKKHSIDFFLLFYLFDYMCHINSEVQGCLHFRIPKQ